MASAVATLAVSGTANATGIVSSIYSQGLTTNTPGDTISYTGSDNSGKAKTEYGANHIEGQSLGSTINVLSDWEVDFSLSEAATLLVFYSIDFINQPGSSVTYKLNASNTSDYGFTRYGITVISNQSSGSNNDVCTDRNPSGGPDGYCAGAHGGSGTVAIPFNAGPDALEGMFNGVAGVPPDGYATGFDGFNTAKITQIIVPDGVTWTYNGVDGNPLKFQYAAAPTGAPEPFTLSLMGAGLAGVAAMRRMKKKAA